MTQTEKCLLVPRHSCDATRGLALAFAFALDNSFLTSASIASLSSIKLSSSRRKGTSALAFGPRCLLTRMTWRVKSTVLESIVCAFSIMFAMLAIEGTYYQCRQLA